MIEMKTADLIGEALDWAVAKAEGMRQYTPDGLKYVYWYLGGRCIGTHWQPSTSWSQGGPLIEKHDVMVAYSESRTDWEASAKGDIYMHYAPTPLIAVCRAVVFKALGEAVSVPSELCP